MTIDIQITPSPLDEPGTWDYVQIEDVRLPCLGNLPDASVGRKVDAKGKAGSDSVTITDKGQDVNEVKITLTFWLPEHFQTWDEIKDLVCARRRASERRPLSVYHPALAQLGINSIYTKKVSALKFKSVGMYEVTIEAYEYRDPPRRRNVTRRAQNNSSDFVRDTAFTGTIRQATAATIASTPASRPSNNGASNP